MAINTTQLMFSDIFHITDYISVRHSTIGDVILNLGEQRYFRTLSILTAIPSDEKYLLHTKGIDWMEISDLEFFAMMVKALPKEDTQIFIPGIDFSKFELYRRPDGEVLFSDKQAGATFDFRSHQMVADCLCKIHKIKKKVEKAGNAFTKQVLIDEDKEKKERMAANQTEFKSSLLPLISSLVNRDGFKYNYQTVMDLRYAQFMDAAARVQLIAATDQLIQGVYNGTIDQSKLDKKKLDWTRDI